MTASPGPIMAGRPAKVLLPAEPEFSRPAFSVCPWQQPITGCAIVGGAFYNPAINQFPSSYLG